MGQTPRRQFIIGTSALLAGRLASAQTATTPFRIGILQVGNEPIFKSTNEAFLDGLRERGYVVGQNLIADFRYGDGWDPLPALADELIARKPDCLAGSEVTGIVMKSRTSTIPIVLLTSADPVVYGLVQSLGRPGTNVTGMSGNMYVLAAKQVEILAEMVPGMSRLALLTDSFRPPQGTPYFGRPDAWETAVRQAAQAKGLTLLVVKAGNVDELRAAFASIRADRVEGLVVANNAVVLRLYADILGAIAQLRVPAIFGNRGFVRAGALLSYGANGRENYRYAAKFVDLILKGAKPGDLPVEQVSRFELHVNRKTARELGLAIPQSILVRADEVIE